jgi:hypothetical protein
METSNIRKRVLVMYKLATILVALSMVSCSHIQFRLGEPPCKGPFCVHIVRTYKGRLICDNRGVCETYSWAKVRAVNNTQRTLKARITCTWKGLFGKNKSITKTLLIRAASRRYVKFSTPVKVFSGLGTIEIECSWKATTRL